jgi:threonine aldolase
VKEVVERSRTGRVDTGVGAILIESPVRRKLGEMFDYEEMKRVCAFARENGIKTHLDGARLYMASGYTGISPREYASHFDTVYVSLWKYFNAASGAILAGPRDTIDGLYHTRRMFGGGLPGAWPFAAVSLHYLAGFESEFGAAVGVAQKLFAMLDRSPSFSVAKIPNGTNLFKLTVRTPDAAGFRERVKRRNVLLPQPRGAEGEFLVAVNATWNRTDAETLMETLRASA